MQGQISGCPREEGEGEKLESGYAAALEGRKQEGEERARTGGSKKGEGGDKFNGKFPPAPEMRGEGRNSGGEKREEEEQRGNNSRTDF